jgi:cytochrome c-type biogenesis protein CcmH
LIIFFTLAVIIALLVLAAFFWPLRHLLGSQKAGASVLNSVPNSVPDVEQQAEWQAVWNTLAAQRTELEADAEAASLSADAKAESLREWGERADAALAAVQPEAERSQAPLLRWGLASAVIILIAAAAIYGWLGNPGAIGQRVQPALLSTAESSQTEVDPNAAHAGSAEAVQDMVKGLEAKLAAQPDNIAGWALLARSKGQMGDFAGASVAYEQALKLAPHDPDLLADAADVLGMVQGRNLQGRPAQMIADALAIDPQHRKSLALAASAAMQRGQKAEAIAFWQRLRATFAKGSEDATEIDQVLAQLGAGGIREAFADVATNEPVTSAPFSPIPLNQIATKEPANSTAAGDSKVVGVIEVAPALAGKISAGSTLFIYARATARAAASGGSAPRMPLAVLRMSVPAFPARFLLDDSMAMAPGMNLSGASAVDIDARISVSGQATPQPGDLRGHVLGVKPGTGNVRIVIEAVQP